MPMCYNMGRTDVCQNGMFVQLSAMLDSHDPTWDRGKLTFIDECNESEVGMMYSHLSPRESRKLAKDLLDYAEHIENEYNNDPSWVILYNNEIAYGDGSALVFNTEDEVKKAVMDCRESFPEDHWGYRKMTIDEFYAFMDH